MCTWWGVLSMIWVHIRFSMFRCPLLHYALIFSWSLWVSTTKPGPPRRLDPAAWFLNYFQSNADWVASVLFYPDLWPVVSVIANYIGINYVYLVHSYHLVWCRLFALVFSHHSSDGEFSFVWLPPYQSITLFVPIHVLIYVICFYNYATTFTWYLLF